jgi:hypothetical protein
MSGGQSQNKKAFQGRKGIDGERPAKVIAVF